MELRVLEPSALGELIRILRDDGYRVIAPTVRDGAIVLDEVTSEAELPIGWRDLQEPGRYRLERRDDDALFGYAVGPSSAKRFLHPPTLELWRAPADAGDAPAGSDPAAGQIERFAFVGLRPCELAAVRIQDRVFLGGPFQDPHYRARREAALIVAVACGEPASTCFCPSMGTGPEVGEGADLELTEVLDERAHLFVARADSPRGGELLAALGAREATDDEARRAAAVTERARDRIANEYDRDFDAAAARDHLPERPDHPRYKQAAARCLACANCTMVCPTCFCVAASDHADLTGSVVWRERRWDSCFNPAFSYLHGGGVRSSGIARYRQWLTHKLATWHDQFGTAGCVGCGRCITWCPVGIDLTEEARAIVASPPEAGALPTRKEGPRVDR